MFSLVYWLSHYNTGGSARANTRFLVVRGPFHLSYKGYY